MDCASVRFWVTLKSMKVWRVAYIQFPTYYLPEIGYYVTCGLENKHKVTVKQLHCEVQWDWTLKLWSQEGSNVTVEKNIWIDEEDEVFEFVIRIDGVQMNNQLDENT